MVGALACLLYNMATPAYIRLVPVKLYLTGIIPIYMNPYNYRVYGKGVPWEA